MNRSSPSTTPAPTPRRVLLALTLILVVLIAMAHIYDELLPSREPPGPEEPPLWTRQNELPVDLSRFFNNDGIASQAEPNDTNFDCPDHPPTIPGSGYPAEELPDGASVFRAEELDASFLFPVIATGEPNNVACKGQRITDPSEPGWLDAGHGCTAIAVLGAAENGAARAKVTLEYEDGSVATRTLSFPDWCVAPETGAVVAWSAPYRYAWDQGQGRNGRHEIDCHLYAARLSVDGGRRLAAIRLPEQPNLHIFALTLQVEPGAVEIARRGNALAARYRKVAELADQPPADLSEPVSALAAELEAAESRVPPDLRRQLVWLETQYEYLTHKIGRRRVLSGSRTEEWARTWMTAIRSDLAELLAGVDPFDDRRGNILKGYVSDIDGRIQPYTVYVPDSYTPGRPTPLVVHMHGHGWYRPFQGYPTYPFRDAVVLSPHGRGSMDYMFVGEEDVLDAITEVEHDYTIDRRRVYLLGSSMGGTGCWNLGTKYPDRFAAVGPIAANADSRAWADVAARHPADTGRFARLRRRLRTKNDPVTFAGNLLHTTIYFLHGAEDRVVPVENSRSMARALERAGCSFTYREGKRGGHGWKPGRIVGDQHDAIFAARLTERPRRVQLRAGRLKHGRAFWLRILRFGRRDRYGEVNAEVSDGSLIQVRPSNVTAFEIDLARCPIDTAEAVAVTVDGVPVFTDMVSARSRLRLARAGPRWQVGFTPPGLQKKPGLEGPVSDVFTGPFLVVVGTQSPEAFDRRILEKEAQRFAADWELRYTKPPRVKLDHEVTPEDIADHHLVLYGGPNDNTVTARINDRLPVRVRNGAVEVGAHRVYRGEGLAAKLCYPNPLNAERLAVVIAGAGRARDIFQSNNLFGNWFQWGPYDNRTWFDYAVFDRKSRSAETCLEFGFFGYDWRLRPETTWFGAPGARAEAPARRVPRHTVPPPGRKIVYLSDLLPVSIDQHKMPVGFDTSAEGRPLSVGPADASRRVFRRGLGVHAPSKITFRLHGPETPPAERFHRFRATVGIDLEGERQVSQWRKKKEWVQFFVRGDGHLLYRTGRMKWNSKPVDIDVPVSRVEELELQVWCTNARWLVGSAAWGSARVIRQKAPGPDDAPADPGS